MKVSVGFPVYGDPIARFGIDAMLDVVSDAGVDGLWAGDHLALSRTDASRYPGRASGRFFLPPDEPWYEAFTAIAYMAGRLPHLEFGFAVALAALRPPLAIAKQTATLAALVQGDVHLGVGAGWLRSEYEAVGVPFEGRGRRLDDCIRVIREYWTGEPTPGQYGDYFIPEGLTTYPTPPRPVPILVGGASEVAFDRAARLGDGWIGLLQEWDGGDEIVARHVARLREHWRSRRPEGDEPLLGVIAPIAGSVSRREEFPQLLHERLTAFSRVGMDKVVLSVSWRDLEHAHDVLRLIAATATDIQEESGRQRSLQSGGK